MRIGAMASLRAGIVVCLVKHVYGLGAGAKIPDPTNVFKEYGMNAFATMKLRFSMTVSVMNTRDQTYLGPRYNEQTEAYELHSDFPERTPETYFELIDAGTMDNIPANTRPRPADLYDTNTQKFFLRFNETLILRSQSINKYVATTGTNFNSDLFFTDDVTLSERFRMVSVFKNIAPHIKAVTNNENMEDETTYVKNGTQLHLLNSQQNFLNKIENQPKALIHGVGTTKKGMWGLGSDVFQIIMQKMYEE